MRSAQEEIETVRTMAEAMIKINNTLHDPSSGVDFPEIEMSQADIPADHPFKQSEDVETSAENIEQKIELTDENFDQTDIDGAEGWWNAWCEVRKILDEAFECDVEGGDHVTMTEGEPNGDMRIQNDVLNLRVRLYNGVGVSYVAEYCIGESDTWVMLFEGDTPRQQFETELTRDVVRTELAIIANATQSAAETIDYWMTEQGGYSWSQSEWAEIRGVGRQTVNDRVRSAADTVEN